MSGFDYPRPNERSYDRSGLVSPPLLIKESYDRNINRIKENINNFSPTLMPDISKHR